MSLWSGLVVELSHQGAGFIYCEAELRNLSELYQVLDLVLHLAGSDLEFLHEFVAVLQATDTDDGMIELAFDNDIGDGDQSVLFVLLIFVDDSAEGLVEFGCDLFGSV